MLKYHESSRFSCAMVDIMRSWFPDPKVKPKESSIFALMGDGSMKSDSLSRMIYDKLIKAFNDKYKDNPDRDALLSAMTTNYYLEVENAWQAFMAEVGDGGDDD